MPPSPRRSDSNQDDVMSDPMLLLAGRRCNVRLRLTRVRGVPFGGAALGFGASFRRRLDGVRASGLRSVIGTEGDGRRQGVCPFVSHLRVPVTSC